MQLIDRIKGKQKYTISRSLSLICLSFTTNSVIELPLVVLYGAVILLHRFRMTKNLVMGMMKQRRCLLWKMRLSFIMYPRKIRIMMSLKNRKLEAFSFLAFPRKWLKTRVSRKSCWGAQCFISDRTI